MGAGGFDTVARNLEIWSALHRAKLESALDATMQQAAHWVNTEHTYTARTGNTEITTVGGIWASRSGTFAGDPNYIAGIVSSGMSYDYFLELARAGKWAYLWPIMRAHEAQFLPMIQAQYLRGGPGGDALRMTAEAGRLRAGLRRGRGERRGVRRR